jgi:Xaa-Pro aminopeptidase
MATAIATIKKSSIRNRKLYLSGKILTSEKVRKLIHLKLTELGCIPTRTIVACGKQSASPHNEGSGPLYAHRPIVIDIFPKNAASCYFADLTRTVVRGRATPKLKRMYAAVREAQHIAFRMIRHGAEASEIHAAIGRRFSELGFTTGTRNGRTEGFFHGTGHGLGLEIHELPKISLGRQKLAAGNVVTVEPGLYYQDTGGIRLEDDIVVTQKGCRKLSHLPQCLEI